MQSDEIERKACGCIISRLADGRNMYSPCLACGLFQCAKALSRARFWWGRRKALEDAAQSLAAVATTIQGRQKDKSMMDEVVSYMTKDGTIQEVK